jgi:hypothetical protein
MSQAREVGELRSSQGAAGLATLRLDALQAGDLQAAGVALSVSVPAWANLPQAG